MNGEIPNDTMAPSVTVKTEKDDPTSNGSKFVSNDPEDPDPVIHEIPVFLAKALSQKLFMFQVCSSTIMSSDNKICGLKLVYIRITPLFRYSYGKIFSMHLTEWT